MYMKKRLVKSRDRKLTGVLGGFAEYFGWDSTWVRIIFAILVVLTGIFPFVIIYIFAALIMDSPESVKVTDV